MKNRLLLTDLLRRHPEIHDIEVEAPIIIAGLPRTGTTHLHNLLAADPALRYLPYWESIEPIPVPAESRARARSSRRTHRTGAVGSWTWPCRSSRCMHEITPWAAHEEIHLLAIDFSTMFFETLALRAGLDRRTTGRTTRRRTTATCAPCCRRCSTCTTATDAGC